MMREVDAGEGSRAKVIRAVGCVGEVSSGSWRNEGEGSRGNTYRSRMSVDTNLSRWRRFGVLGAVAVALALGTFARRTGIERRRV